MVKAVLDTNVFISSLISTDGTCARIITYLFLDRFINFSSTDIIREFKRVCGYPKISRLHKLSEDKIDIFIESLKSYSVKVVPKSIPDVVKNDKSDNIFIACAYYGNVDFIVSGDKHLISLKEYNGIPIINPGEFLRIIESQHK